MKTFWLAVLIIFNLALMRPALAQEEIRILPSNPFYFLKEWQRGIKVVLSGPHKAGAILEVLEDKALDFRKSNDQRVLASYKDSLNQLLPRTGEILQNDQLLNKLFDHSLNYYDIFDVQILAKLFKESDRPEGLIKILTSAVARRPEVERELLAAELLEGADDINLIPHQEDFLIKFIGRLMANDSLLANLKNLGGDPWRRLRVLDQAREIIGDSDLKNQFNITRQQILEMASRSVSEIVSRNAIESAAALVDNLSGQVNASNQLLTRAKFNLQQSQELQDSRNYGGAFGQASAAAAVAKVALRQLAYDPASYQEELTAIKEQYESLLTKSKNNDQAWKLLDEAKKKINRLSKSAILNVPLLRNVKILLATVENLL